MAHIFFCSKLTTGVGPKEGVVNNRVQTTLRDYASSQIRMLLSEELERRLKSSKKSKLQKRKFDEEFSRPPSSFFFSVCLSVGKALSPGSEPQKIRQIVVVLIFIAKGIIGSFERRKHDY